VNATAVAVTEYRVPAKHRPQGKRHPATWEELAARLASPLDAPNKEALPGWSLAIFADDYRREDNVREVHALCFDVDEEPRCSLGELRAILEPYRALIHSTYRHTPEAPRWRVMVLTSRPMTAEEYTTAWSTFRRTVLGSVGVGSAAKDPSRFWYQPGHAPGAPYDHAVTGGPALDVDALLTEPRQDAPDPAPPPAPPRPNRPDLVTRARLWLAHAEPAVSGQAGHDTAFRIIERVVRGFDLSDDEALSVLFGWNARCEPPWSEKELRHKISDGRARGDTPIGSVRDEAPKAKGSPSEAASGNAIARQRVTLADAFRMRRQQGPLEREPTEIASLDRWLGGGLPYGTTIALVGLPDVAKTLVCVQIAHTYARRGIACGLYTTDEEIGDSLVRLVQRTPIDGAPSSEHFTRADYERGGDDLIELMQAAVGELPLVYYDAEWTVESAAADLHAYAHSLGTRAALFVDSVQTVTCDALRSIEEASERRQVSENARAIRRAGVRYAMITAFTSESNREHGKAKRRGEKGIAMSAGAESRAIEFRSRAQLVLSPAGDDLIEVAIPKNKLGPRSGDDPAFFLRIDRARQELSEAPAPETPAPSAAPSARQTARRQSQETERRQTEARRARERQQKAEAAEAERNRVDAVVRQAMAEGLSGRALRVEVKARAHVGTDVADVAIARCRPPATESVP